ncbi:MAG: CIA30 family protein [Pseudomonadota bacterium]
MHSRRLFLKTLLVAAVIVPALSNLKAMAKSVSKASAIIDDFSQPGPRASTGARWEYVADGVMGGVSQGQMRLLQIDGRKALRLTGDVSLANNGGFVQAALDLSSDGSAVDASGFTGIAITVRGNGAAYDLRLRTTDLTRPWQSYRASFQAPASWTEVRLPFAEFVRNKTDAPFDAGRLRRIGILAIGREFAADVAISDVRFY